MRERERERKRERALAREGYEGVGRFGVTINLTLPRAFIVVEWMLCYGVATISRLLKVIGLFCQRAQEKRLYSANETYNLKEPIDRHGTPVIQTSTIHQKSLLSYQTSHTSETDP